MANEAKVVWKAGLQFEGTSGGHIVQLDGIAEAGGEDMGFRPMNLLLVSLCGCTAMDVISVLKKMRQDVTGFAVAATGQRAAEHPRVFTDIEVVYTVSGRNLDPELVQKAVTLSRDKYCSVEGMLKQSVNMTYRVDLVPEP